LRGHPDPRAEAVAAAQHLNDFKVLEKRWWARQEIVQAATRANKNSYLGACGTLNVVQRGVTVGKPLMWVPDADTN
jgi:hypothetical protein